MNIIPSQNLIVVQSLLTIYRGIVVHVILHIAGIGIKNMTENQGESNLVLFLLPDYYPTVQEQLGTAPAQLLCTLRINRDDYLTYSTKKSQNCFVV